MSREGGNTNEGDISESSDFEEVPVNHLRPASKTERRGRPSGTTQVDYDDAEKGIAFRLLMRECPEKPSGRAFLAELNKDLPSRTTVALQTFTSKTMRECFPKIFQSVYNNDWSLLSTKQTNFVCMYMAKNNEFLRTRNSSGSVNRGASTSSGKTAKKRIDFRPLALKYSTPKRKKSESSSSAWPDLSPVQTYEEDMKRFADTVAQSIMRKWMSKPINTVQYKQEEENDADNSDDDDEKEERTGDRSNDEEEDRKHGGGITQEETNDVGLVKDGEKTEDDEVSDDGSTSYVGEKVPKKDKKNEDGPSKSDDEIDEDVGTQQKGIELNEEDMETASILLKSSLSTVPISSDEGIQSTSTDVSINKQVQLRARISTINLIDVFPKGYKGRDSPFVVNIENGHINIQHTSDMLSDCSTDVAVGYRGHDNSAVESIIKLDAVSSADMSLPLTPMKIVPKKGGDSKFQRMSLSLPGNVKVPVLLKTTDGIQLLAEEED